MNAIMTVCRFRCDSMGKPIGRLVARLDDFGLREYIFVMFIGDHGRHSTATGENAQRRPAASPADQDPPSRSLLTRPGVWLVTALLAAAGTFAFFGAAGQTKTPFSTVVAERGDIESTVAAAGILQPIKHVDVGAQTSGRLKSLKVNRGDRVEENQLLAEIDPILATTALTAASATLENITWQLAAKQANLTLAKLQSENSEKLFTQQLISSFDLDLARANRDVALAEVASLTAQKKQVSAQVETARANLNYTKITAPIAGDVVSISVVEGQTLNANQQTPNILRIADLGTMTAWTQVSEADIARVRPGQEVYFTTLGQPRRRTGRIRQILPTPTLVNNVVFYDVLFDVPNPERELRIQMTAQVFIVLAQAKDVVLIPVAAIGNAREDAETRVRVLKADGGIEMRTIRIGIRSEIAAQVTRGLVLGDQVVIREVAPKKTTKGAFGGKK